MEYGKTELIEKLINSPVEGWSRQKIKDLIDSLWRNPTQLRWSGFEHAGSPDSVIAFDNSTRIFTIAPVEKAFSYYQFNNKLTYHVHTKAHEVEISNAAGLHIIYFDFDEVTLKQILRSKHNPSAEDVEKIYLFRVVVAWIFWAPGNEEIPGTAIYFGDSRHGSEWPSQVHWWNHITSNSMRESGLTIAGTLADRDGSSNTHAQLTVTAGLVAHSDFTRTCCSPDGFAIWYMVGGAPGIVYNPGYVFYTIGRVCYNSGGPAPADNDWFVMYHLFATNCKIMPVISAMGLAQYNKIGDAYLNMESEIDTIRHTFPHSNMMYIGSVILQSNDEYENSVKTRIVTSLDLDEKVAMANEETGLITSKPGYLDDRYFEFIDAFGKRMYRPKFPAQLSVGDIIYLHQNDSDIDDYLQALMLNPDEAEYTISAEAFEGEEAFQSFATDVDYPGSTVIPGGMWLFETWVALADATGMNYLIIRVYKRNLAEEEELLFEVESVLSSETVKKYDINSKQDDITLEDTDRLVFKYYFYTTDESNTATLYMEGGENYSRIRTPISRKKDGKDGTTPHIGQNGNWYIGQTDTGVPAAGQPGADGQDGYTPVKGVDYFDGEDGSPGSDGTTPHIGQNGNWYIGQTDTGVPAAGQPGADGQDGYTPVKGVDYFDGEDGQPGADGTSTYTYVAYASDNTGTGFSLTPTDLLKYRAEIQVQTPLSPPTSTDFASAVWVKYLGDDGDPGGGGGESNFLELALDFGAACEFVYKAATTMKFTSVAYEDGAPTLIPALDTTLNQYDTLTVTATTPGLVIIRGEILL